METLVGKNERPIIFNSQMVNAILDGRKTQTRRVIEGKWLPIVEKCLEVNGRWVWDTIDYELTTPYGKPGDRLYVRESFWIHMLSNGETIVRYAATEKSTPSRLRPAIHMPRSASRLTLEITEVRVERLRDISEEDAIAEGVYNGGEDKNWHGDLKGTVCRSKFKTLWDSINGKKHPWESNPWVWVVSFRRVEG